MCLLSVITLENSFSNFIAESKKGKRTARGPGMSVFVIKLILFIVHGCLLNLMHTSSNATDREKGIYLKLWEVEYHYF